MFCNGCGGEMQAGALVCPQCGTAFDLLGNSLPATAIPAAPLQMDKEPSGYYFGRFYALSKIAGGSILGLMIVFHAPWVTPLLRPQLELTAVISLATGYGLLKKQIWALYLMTAAFFMSIMHVVMAGEQHIPVRLLPLGVLWNLIGLWYFWEHRRELE